MEKYLEVAAQEFVQLMTNYLEGKIGVRNYQRGIFDLMKKRMNPSTKEWCIFRQAFDDADDFDPEIRLGYTIEEPELRERVRKSWAELVAMGNASRPEQ